jgi:hypothetical protein
MPVLNNVIKQYAMKAYEGGGGSTILDFGTRWR